MRFKDSFKSYLLVTGLGLVAGLLTTLLNLFPYDTLWSLSSIATLFGFWMISITLVIYFSSSNKNASINVFLYLASMNFNFYFLQGVLGIFIARFYNAESFINWGLLNMYNALALVCSIVSFVLYYWNKENKLSSFLYALPVSGLVAETIGVSIYLYNNHTFLFQLIFDSLSLIILGCWFYKKANNKLISRFVAVFVELGKIKYFQAALFPF